MMNHLLHTKTLLKNCDSLEEQVFLEERLDAFESIEPIVEEQHGQNKNDLPTQEELDAFLKKLDVGCTNNILGTCIDKCSGYRNLFKEKNIPFQRAVCLYVLTRVKPYSEMVRETPKGWIDPIEWIIDNYAKFQQYF